MASNNNGFTATGQRAPGLEAAVQEERAVASSASVKTVYVYEAPVRIWHWTNALATVVLIVTGYLIASPLPSPGGEASDHYMMGYIRFAHFSAGYIMGVGFLGRVYWAAVGNYYAKELFWVPLFQLDYWKDVWAMFKWYAFISARPGIYIGHNPLARFAMFFAYMLTSVFMMLTGFAMYSEGQQAGGLYEQMFGWVITLLGQSQDVHTWHHLGLWAVVIFIILHVYAAVREEILGRTSMVSTMVSGYRTFKD